jgi:hypothetical protein
MVKTYQNYPTTLQDKSAKVVRPFPMPNGFLFSSFASFWIFVLVGTNLSAAAEVGQAPVNFSREVLPILSDRCFHCHGPDPGQRKADLRLDLESEATRELDGVRPIKPHDATRSEVWQRLITQDEDEMMPPPDSHRKPLSDVERELIRRWIDEGAVWGKHWSFEKPVRPAIPDSASHPIDAFVRKKLESEALAPSPPATTATQLRRLSFSLTGLPPTPAEVEVFSHSPSPEAWNQQIDRLLRSPHFGERLAMWWLDAARYSDTDGFQGDAERTNWPWRDWVVDAFNQNMPFDQFTKEQFAGDLLPKATPEQILATCFHRNHMTNGEGGRDPEESRIDYVIDRVNTTGTVWLGLTLGCTQCHTHKFDPITHEDYYRFSAFFDSIAEDGRAGSAAVPYFEYRSPYAARALSEMTAYVETLKPGPAKSRATAEQRFNDTIAGKLAALSKDYRAWTAMQATSVTSVEGTEFFFENKIVGTRGPAPFQDDYRFTIGAVEEKQRITGWKLEVFPHPSHTDGKLARGKSGEFILTNVKLLVRKKGDSQVREIEHRGAVADFEQKAEKRNYGLVKDTLDDDPRNGWTTQSGDAHSPHTAVFELKNPFLPEPDEELIFVLLHRSTEGNANIGRFRISTTSEVGETVRSLATSPLEEAAHGKELTGPLRNRLFEQFLIDDTAYQKDLERLNEGNRQLAEIQKANGKTKVMVLAERPEPRETHILERGVWDAKGPVVKPGILPAILPLPDDQVRTRLDLANWIVSPENPLTARVTVNHLWQLMFGSGLVRSPEDFGLQGEKPTHPDLLDWLAVELVEHHWDIQHILRLIATSDTYRQSSTVTEELLERDPDNRLLARSSRYRLPAWMIRDSALQNSGLLNPAIGGPPVKPWQPEGVWEEIFMGRYTYQPSVGPSQYRRTLYTYWRRSSSPTFLFDSAQRRVCEVRTNRTNTPLQALTLLNDTGMLEASRALADEVAVTSASADFESGISELGRHILQRDLASDEITVLKRELNKSLDYYSSAPDDAVTFTTVGQQLPLTTEQAPTVAAWMTVASLMLNLDEAITQE